MKTLLLTGSGGFIGRNVIDFYESKDVNLILVDTEECIAKHELNKVTPFETIDWNTFDHAQKQLSPTQYKVIHKYIHNWLPVGSSGNFSCDMLTILCHCVYLMAVITVLHRLQCSVSLSRSGSPLAACRWLPS